MTNDLVHYKRPGEDFTGHCTAAVTGKRFLVISGNLTSGPGLSDTAEGGNPRVAPAGAGAHAIGVAKFDAPNGGKVGVVRAGILPITAGATIGFGEAVESGATGRAIPLAAGVKLGVCMSDAVLDGDAEIALMLS